MQVCVYYLYNDEDIGLTFLSTLFGIAKHILRVELYNGGNTNAPDTNSVGNIGTTYSNSMVNNCDRHESEEYYYLCQQHTKNHGLFHADQNLNGDSQLYTPQNLDGTSRGLECPEERDYFPWWHPGPFHDIAIVTLDADYRETNIAPQSQNGLEKYQCVKSFQTVMILQILMIQNIFYQKKHMYIDYQQCCRAATDTTFHHETFKRTHFQTVHNSGSNNNNNNGSNNGNNSNGSSNINNSSNNNNDNNNNSNHLNSMNNNKCNNNSGNVSGDDNHSNNNSIIGMNNSGRRGTNNNMKQRSKKSNLADIDYEKQNVWVLLIIEAIDSTNYVFILSLQDYYLIKLRAGTIINIIGIVVGFIFILVSYDVQNQYRAHIMNELEIEAEMETQYSGELNIKTNNDANNDIELTEKNTNTNKNENEKLVMLNEDDDDNNNDNDIENKSSIVLHKEKLDFVKDDFIQLRTQQLSCLKLLEQINKLTELLIQSLSKPLPQLKSLEFHANGHINGHDDDNDHSHLSLKKSCNRHHEGLTTYDSSETIDLINKNS